MTNDEATFTPQQAAAALAALGPRSATLTQHSEGFTWALWGILFAGTFLTYSTRVAPEAMKPLLWIPWFAAGALLQWAYWRGLAITPKAGVGRSQFTLILAAGVGGLVAAAAMALPIRVPEAGLAILGIGIAVLIVAVRRVLSPLGTKVAWLLSAMHVACTFSIPLLDLGQVTAGVMGACLTFTWIFAGAFQMVQG